MQTCEELRVEPGKIVSSSADASLPRWKRVLDIGCIVLLGPIFILPLAGLIAIAIKLYSKGPILFRQERIGYKGKHFICLKFRSMKLGADQTAHKNHLQQLIKDGRPMVKLDQRGDSRIFGFGKLLRATGLDELPQFINVLRGEMSIVGPRPCLPYEYEEYPAWAMKRFDALPGLTGYWQVYGKNRTTFTEMIKMDIWYVENQSLMLDLMIIVRTPLVLIRQFVESLFANRNRE